MKKTNTLLLTLALPFATFAQAPTLTAANTIPASGTPVASFSTTAAFNPGGAGANQTWDFSTLNYQPEPNSVYGDCSSAGANCAPFANPNLVLFGKGNGADVVTYFRTSSALQTTVGGKVSSQSNYDITYSKPRDVLRFPMAFNTSFTNSWTSSGTVSGLAVKGGGTDTIKADAWGIIKTPSGSFRALRVRTSCTQYDTTRNNGIIVSILVSNFVSYNWYDGVNKGPVYTGSITTTFNGSNVITNIIATYATAVPSGIGTLAGSPFSWRVAPNPATGHRIQVLVEGKNSASVSLQLVDLMGCQVRNLPAQQVSTGTLALETAGLPAGTYILSVVANGEPQGTQCVTVFQ